MAYLCPRDRIPMSWVHFALNGRWACRQCNGTIAYEKHIQHHPSGTGFLIALRQLPSQQSRQSCPACGDGMHQTQLHHSQSRIQIDRCKNCGLIWFDSHELKVITGSLTQQRPDPNASTEDQNRFYTEQRFFQTLDEIWSDLNSRWKMRMLVRYEATIIVWRYVLPIICLLVLIRSLGVRYHYQPQKSDIFDIYKSAPSWHALKAFVGSVLFAWKPSLFWVLLFLVFFWLFSAIAVLKVS